MYLPKSLCQCFDTFLLMHQHFDQYFTRSLYKKGCFFMLYSPELSQLLIRETCFIFPGLDFKSSRVFSAARTQKYFPFFCFVFFWFDGIKKKDHE